MGLFLGFGCVARVWAWFGWPALVGGLVSGLAVLVGVRCVALDSALLLRRGCSEVTTGPLGVRTSPPEMASTSRAGPIELPFEGVPRSCRLREPHFGHGAISFGFTTALGAEYLVQPFS